MSFQEIMSIIFFMISHFGIGWLAIDLISRRRPSIIQNWLSIILAGMIISNLSIQIAWLVTGNWMGLETFGTGVREIFLLSQDREIILMTIFTTCAVLLSASLIKRSIAFRRLRSARRTHFGQITSTSLSPGKE